MFVDVQIDGFARRNLEEFLKNYVRHIMAVAAAFDVVATKQIPFSQSTFLIALGDAPPCQLILGLTRI